MKFYGYYTTIFGLFLIGTIQNQAMQQLSKKTAQTVTKSLASTSFKVPNVAYKPYIPHIQQQALEEFKFALKNNDVKKIKELLSTDIIDIGYIYDKLLAEIQSNTFLLLPILYEPELKIFVYKLFAYALDKNNIDVPKALLQTGIINANLKFEQALHSNDIPLLKALLNTTQISPDKILHAFEDAVKRQNFIVVEIFLDADILGMYQPILKFAIDRSVKHLIQNINKPGNYSLLSILLQSPHVSHDTIDLEFDAMVQQNNLPMVQLFLNTNKVLGHYKLKAYEYATKNNNNQLIKILNEYNDICKSK